MQKNQKKGFTGKESDGTSLYKSQYFDITASQTKQRDAIRSIFIVNLLGAILILGSTLAIFVWTLVKPPKGIVAYLDTTFFTWNDVTQSFTNVLLNVGSYRVIILLLVGTLVSGIFSTIKVYAQRNVGKYFFNCGGSFRSAVGYTTMGKSFFNPGKGVSVIRWIEEIVSGSLLWFITASGAQVTNILLIFGLILLHIGSVFAFWIFEEGLYWYFKYVETNTYKPLISLNKFLTQLFDKFPLLLPWILGLVLQMVLWTFAFIYLGFATISNFPETRLFIIIIIPIHIFLKYVVQVVLLYIKYNDIITILLARFSKDSPLTKEEVKSRFTLTNLDYEFASTLTAVIATITLLWLVSIAVQLS